MSAVIVLEDGLVLPARAAGARGTALGEMVFTTGMIGYQEAVTDPSYMGQILTFSAPMIGNYGTGDRCLESPRVWPEAVIATRIGWTQWTHGNQPGPHMAMGRWGQLMWLSDRDFLSGMTAAATTPATGFVVVNLMSNNPGMRWSLEETRRALGFTPQDGAPATLPLPVRLKEFGAWLSQTGIPRLMKRMTGPDW